MEKVRKRGKQEGRGKAGKTSEKPKMSVVIDFDVPEDKVSVAEIKLLQHFAADLFEEILNQKELTLETAIDKGESLL